ncbi:hypothetical protein DFJ77DRAFT_441643 [Powellomyces hirtus]|nr:hypothetical protein DFJ77DRAFT_441643 [Powellomyces hirtus]
MPLRRVCQFRRDGHNTIGRSPRAPSSLWFQLPIHRLIYLPYKVCSNWTMEPQPNFEADIPLLPITPPAAHFPFIRRPRRSLQSSILIILSLIFLILLASILRQNPRITLLPDDTPTTTNTTRLTVVLPNIVYIEFPNADVTRVHVVVVGTNGWGHVHPILDAETRRWIMSWPFVRGRWAVGISAHGTSTHLTATHTIIIGVGGHPPPFTLSTISHTTPGTTPPVPLNPTQGPITSFLTHHNTSLSARFSDPLIKPHHMFVANTALTHLEHLHPVAPASTVFQLPDVRQYGVEWWVVVQGGTAKEDEDLYGVFGILV